MNNIYLQIPERYESGSPLVLVTVTGTSGSTPCKPGSSALFGVSGLLAGTVGGGILEAKVQDIAMKMLDSEDSGYFHFNLDHEMSSEYEAICGGSAEVLVSFINEEQVKTLLEMKRSLGERKPGVLVTRISGIQNKNITLSRYWISDNDSGQYKGNISLRAETEALNMIGKRDVVTFRTLNEEAEDAVCFFEPISAPFHLVIAGAGHIGKALAHLGRLLDFEVTVIDYREEYANSENIPDAGDIIVGDIANAISKIKKQADTFIVIVTRGHKDDADALRACIDSEAGYIGMIGSRNKVMLMKESFIKNGWASREQWNRIYSPVGLEIGSKTVQEIAVSIAAQLVLVRNKFT